MPGRVTLLDDPETVVATVLAPTRAHGSRRRKASRRKKAREVEGEGEAEADGAAESGESESRKAE